MKRFNITLPLLLTLTLCSLLLCGCSPSGNKTVSKAGFYFDTIITIKLYGTEDDTLINDCFALADHYEHLLSNTLPDSEISQINSAAGNGEWIPVSPETMTIIERGLEYGKTSDGRFDITIGTLSSLWNISDISANLNTENNETDASALPSPEAIQTALETVDYHAVELSGNAVRLNHSGSMIDLGGIAKGYIADRMKEYLIGKGVTSAIINLGGNVVTIGSKPDKSPYQIGIQKPFAENDVIGVVSVSDCSCVTSGVYERYFRVDGQLYHHILNLSDGYPCQNDLYSVTIISSSSMDADALSTVCFALGQDEGMSLIESLDDIEAIFITSDMVCHKSSGIDKKISFRQ